MTGAPITSQLLAKCALQGVDELGTSVCAALGLAVDAGIITLGDLLDLVRSCSTADQLGDALTMLAASANGHCEEVLAIPAGGAQWTR